MAVTRKITQLPIITLAVILFLWPYSGQATVGPRGLCSKFNGIISGHFDYSSSTATTTKDARVDLNLVSFYTDANKEKLYGLLRIDGGGERYQAAVELYPEIKLLLLHSHLRKEDLEKEIADFVEPLKRIEIDRWNGDGKYANLGPVPYEPCYPLVGAIPGKYFDDGKYRLFIRHFPFGIRDSMGRELGPLGQPQCEMWHGNTKQLRFYEAFTPYSFKLKQGRVFVDNVYVGSEKDGEFRYLCDMSDTVGAREKILDEAPGPKQTLDYLSQKGLVRSEDKKHSDTNITGQRALWEMQVLRNLIEGRELYNK